MVGLRRISDKQRPCRQPKGHPYYHKAEDRPALAAAVCAT
jgi:hypothetical protein